MSPFFNLQIFGGFAVLAGPIALLGLAIPYAVLYLRDSRNEEHDTEIGLKSALYFMFSLSILLALAGLTVLVVDFLSEEKGFSASAKSFTDFNANQRNGCAMIVSGFAIGLFHLVVLVGFTNTRRYPAARRVFVGWRLAINSLVVLAAFTALVVQVFQKDVSWDDLKVTFGVLLVWGPSWLIHLLLMRFYGSAVPPSRLRRPTLED